MIISFQITRAVSLRLQTTFPRSPFLLAERIFLKPEVFFIYLSLGWEDKHVTSDFSTRLPLVPPSEFLRKLCRPDLPFELNSALWTSSQHCTLLLGLMLLCWLLWCFLWTNVNVDFLWLSLCCVLCFCADAANQSVGGNSVLSVLMFYLFLNLFHTAEQL